MRARKRERREQDLKGGRRADACVGGEDSRCVCVLSVTQQALGVKITTLSRVLHIMIPALSLYAPLPSSLSSAFSSAPLTSFSRSSRIFSVPLGNSRYARSLSLSLSIILLLHHDPRFDERIPISYSTLARPSRSRPPFVCRSRLQRHPVCRRKGQRAVMPSCATATLVARSTNQRVKRERARESGAPSLTGENRPCIPMPMTFERRRGLVD